VRLSSFHLLGYKKMALVEYGSDSDTEQQQPPSAPAPAPNTSKQALPAVQDEAGSDNDDDDTPYDPTDAFGINRISTEEQPAASSSKAAVVHSAPEVLVQVSLSTRLFEALLLDYNHRCLATLLRIDRAHVLMLSPYHYRTSRWQAALATRSSLALRTMSSSTTRLTTI